VDDLVTDEAFWGRIQREFDVDRSLIHLNNGGVCPAPAFVRDAEIDHMHASGRTPFYAFEGQVQAQKESIRCNLADLFGCDPEEIALTRNTSEGMEIVQLGLELEPGDEILTTEHDYPRMLAAWEQRAEREGIVIRKVPIPVPLTDLSDWVDVLAGAMTDRTRLVMICHMVDLTGQILPVRSVCDAAHARGIPVLVDGAQTFGHVPLSRESLQCDFFATSLHKWLMGPQGTGMLFVSREHIPDVWPLMPAEGAGRADIRKFEDYGTRPPAPTLAVAEAAAFHRSLGVDLKAARLRYLRDYWVERVLGAAGRSGSAVRPGEARRLGPAGRMGSTVQPDSARRFGRAQLLTNLESAGSLATLQIDGIDPLALRNHLWDVHRIRVRPIDQSGVVGIRVSPSIYTSLADLDRFVGILNPIIENGIPTG